MDNKVELNVLRFLTRHQAEGAFWTSDIAHSIKEHTNSVRNALRRLEAQGKVEKVVVGGKGQPTSWKLTVIDASGEVHAS